MIQEKKNVQKIILMTKTEAKILSEKAKSSNMSEGAYVRFLLSQKPNDYLEIRQLLRELINEINHIGVNINQIVKNNNAEFYNPEEKERLFAYMKKLNRLVSEVVVQIGDK